MGHIDAAGNFWAGIQHIEQALADHYDWVQAGRPDQLITALLQKMEEYGKMPVPGSHDEQIFNLIKSRQSPTSDMLIKSLIMMHGGTVNEETMAKVTERLEEMQKVIGAIIDESDS